MRTLTDDLGRTVRVPSEVSRIVSVCPSQTETLFALGAGEQVVGRTRWCILPPEEVATVAIVGGTKKINLRRARALKPDLFLCEKEENTPELVTQAESLAPVFVTDVVDLPSAFRMIRSLGLLTGKEAAAEEMARSVECAWEQVPQLKEAVRVAYLIWQDPWMAAGPGTFIDSVLGRLGFANVFSNPAFRYPVTDLAELHHLQPTYLLLSSEPFSFGESDKESLSAALPKSKVLLVDGQWFSWYGYRMLSSAKELANWLRGSAQLLPFRG